MKREDIKTIYTIEFDKGVFVITKRDKDWIKAKGEYSWVCDTFINPRIEIGSNGILKISGLRLKFKNIRMNDGWNWAPTPLSELSEGWENDIFFEGENIIEKDVVEWVGKWPFKRRVKNKSIKHLEAGRYLQTTGEIDFQTTSNYRLVGYNGFETRGLI